MASARAASASRRGRSTAAARTANGVDRCGNGDGSATTRSASQRARRRASAGAPTSQRALAGTWLPTPAAAAAPPSATTQRRTSKRCVAAGSASSAEPASAWRRPGWHQRTPHRRVNPCVSPENGDCYLRCSRTSAPVTPWCVVWVVVPTTTTFTGTLTSRHYTSENKHELDPFCARAAGGAADRRRRSRAPRAARRRRRRRARAGARDARAWR
mmetsp:Transcript_12934/g.51794  ORF Transcript_12934/g.51794 Transcript_12934/m.51794 type:complete len:214 (+) Transcript_12934:469-1110(+)